MKKSRSLILRLKKNKSPRSLPFRFFIGIRGLPTSKLMSYFDTFGIVFRQTKLVESAIMRRIQIERSNEERFAVNWTNVNETLLEELKSTRRGLHVEEAPGGCIIVYIRGTGFGIDGWKTVRDCFLTCGFDLVMAGSQTWEFVKS